MSAAPQRILLLQLQHLGDVLLTTPAIRAARAAFPDATIDFVTGALGAQAIQDNPHLDNVLLPAMWRVLGKRYDVAVDMHSVPRSARMVAASRARVRIGLRGRGPRNLAYTQLLPREKGSVYMARQKLRLLAPLGVDVEHADLRLEITIREEQRAWAAQAMQQHGLGSAPVVAISPVSKHEFKQWGVHNWARVGDALADAGALILITSGPGEEEKAEAVARAMHHESVWRYGQTTVRQLAALYQRCALWVGNDGGPKHIATAAGTPTVTVYRRKLGGVWSDPDDATQIAINSHEEGLHSIRADQVIEPALELLRKRR